MDAKPRIKWPVVARDDELRQALAALDPEGEFRGVALVGDSGMGKSTLAHVLADRLTADGQSVRFVVGTRGG